MIKDQSLFFRKLNVEDQGQLNFNLHVERGPSSDKHAFDRYIVYVCLGTPGRAADPINSSLYSGNYLREIDLRCVSYISSKFKR